ncbi:MAG: hypothetical protein AUH78_23690 [Gemmatimonadetes bacterium 13_1_40CM_4_69_8]|nr:MAG: hypothetical protein AUH78_23690 [Gemmatimonadetes bacterium 13_1_40CM_4_69_8]
MPGGCEDAVRCHVPRDDERGIVRHIKASVRLLQLLRSDPLQRHAVPSHIFTGPRLAPQRPVHLAVKQALRIRFVALQLVEDNGPLVLQVAVGEVRVLEQASQQLDAAVHVLRGNDHEVGDYLMVRRPVVTPVEFRDFVPESRWVATERMEQQVLVQVGQSGFGGVLRECPVAYRDEDRGQRYGRVFGDDHFQPVVELRAADEPGPLGGGTGDGQEG